MTASSDWITVGALAEGFAPEAFILPRLADLAGQRLELHFANGWRIEWGESQRSYITSREVRLSADIGTPREMLVLVLNRELMETMEKLVFEQYVEDVQTRIDTESPPEMRWLVMFPKLTASELGRLKDRYAAIASIKPWLQLWLGGGLESALADTIEARVNDLETKFVAFKNLQEVFDQAILNDGDRVLMKSIIDELKGYKDETDPSKDITGYSEYVTQASEELQ